MSDFEANLVQTLSDILNQLCERSEDGPKTQGANKFHSNIVPKISILDYLIRIEKYSMCSKECLIIALIYIDRFIYGNETTPNTVSFHSIHRVLITSVMLAAKFYDDQYFNNAYYAKLGGLETAELNALEAEFVLQVRFILAIKDDEMNQYYKELKNHYTSNVRHKLLNNNVSA